MSEYGLIINGRKTTKNSVFDVLNPASGELVGYCPKAEPDDLNTAVQAAQQSYQHWSKTSSEERKKACCRIASVIEKHSDELAILLTREQGKPLSGLGSRFELQGCVAWTRYTAEQELPVEILEDSEAQRVEQHRKPVGVVGSITPWNWPLLIAVWHILPAIRTGNTVVIKPSPNTPLSTLRLIEIIAAELPPGVVNAIAGENFLGAEMSTHPDINKIVFTGSTATGQKVMAGSAQTFKRLTLELGGNDAGIVLPDTNPGAVAEKIFWSAFINNGQTCAALKRLYVHDSLYDEMCANLTKIADSIQIGDGLNEQTQLGPVQNKMQFNKVCELVDDARQRGASILCGGEPVNSTGYFYPPTIVADLTDDFRLVQEEQFGPVLPILKYTDIDEAIERANASELGLGGSVWSANIEQAAVVAQQLECGTAWVNSHANIQPHIPFGGVKASGLGVEFGIPGMEAYTNIHSVIIDKQ